MRRLCSSATRRREWTCGASREPGVQSRLSAPGAERPRPTHARLAMTAHHAAHMDHAHDIGASGAARRACALHLPGSTARILPGDTRRHNCAYYGAYYGWSYFPALPKQKSWGPVKKATPQQPLQGTRATSDFRLPTSEARYEYRCMNTGTVPYVYTTGTLEECDGKTVPRQ